MLIKRGTAARLGLRPPDRFRLYSVGQTVGPLPIARFVRVNRDDIENPCVCPACRGTAR